MALNLRDVPKLDVTWPVLVAAVVFALIGLAGGLGPIDAAVGERVARDHAHPARPPTALLAIDGPTVDRLGAPPWDAATWSWIDEAVATAGLSEVHLVDPPDRMLRGEAPPTHGGHLLLHPVVERLGASGHLRPAEAWGPLKHADGVIDLPRTHGVIRGLGGRAAGRGSAWCAWAPCPSPPTGPDVAAPLSVADRATLQVVSLVALIDGQRLVDPGPLVLLGVTAPGVAPTVPVGARGRPLPWAEAVALAASAARGPRVPVAGPLGLAPALAVIVLLGALVARVERVLPADAWLFVVPLTTGGTGVLLVGLELLHVPIASLALAGGTGPLLVLLGARHRALRLVRRASLQVARADQGFVWEDAVADGSDGVLRTLGALTRNHLPSDRMAWIEHRPGGRIHVVGGYGLPASALESEGLTAARLDRLARRDRARGLLRDGSDHAVVLPVRDAGDAVRGWWVVSWASGDPPPDLAVLTDLAAWVGRRLPSSGRDHLRAWLHLDGELRAMGTALGRSAEARAAQGRILRDAPVALATADRSGQILFRNDAWRARMADAGTPDEPASLRELAWRLGGEARLDERMRALFVAGETVQIGAITLSPAGDGFVAWIPEARQTVVRVQKLVPDSPDVLRRVG